MDKTTRQYFYGDRVLRLEVGDVLDADAEVVVNEVDSALSHQGELSERIGRAGGDAMAREVQQLLREYGEIDSGMALYTSAGALPYKAVIHAVGPHPGEADPERVLEQAVSRSLQLCDLNEWSSVALPAIGASRVELATCAGALYRAITRFWDARQDCFPQQVLLYLSESELQAFIEVVEGQGIDAPALPPAELQTDELSVGEIDLSDEDIADLDDADIDDWFK
jgi:O-acetyl-ADP-ribose deacetylase (regulator of RNase III)